MFQARTKVVLFYLISALFILVNIFFLVNKHSMIINALPVALGIVLLAVFAFDKLLYLVVFFTPLSIPLSEIMPGLPINMFLPTEPLLFGILLIFILKCFSTEKFERAILTHPVSLAIYLSLFWLLVTSLSSTMPIVSIKFLLSRIWFIVGFYLLTAKLFESAKNIEKFVWLYTLPLLMVIFYATYRHLGYGLWDKQAAHFVVDPFYNDHTAYGAAIAMYLPFLFGFSFSKTYPTGIKIVVRVALGILLMGLILSYARAAWISMVAALVIWMIMRLKIRFKHIIITFLVSVSVILVFQHQILMYLERNNTESSANLGDHLSSVSNISTDASNLERINRWSCAIRMFEDKPILGWGPGTYMFNYAPYQLTADRTIISTNSANGGNAHSEYLGPMAESGFLGLITFLILITVVIYTGIHTYSRTNDKRLKTLVMSAILGLITYYIHGSMNNFLDTDKLSLPFWGFTAIIVAVDIYTKKVAQTEVSSENQT
ncbi:MAG: O-antigen ligase family protein [Bacteroidota bacterium]|nr:O-antigen ligase family protein [Bacteroidota bacterium]